MTTFKSGSKHLGKRLLKLAPQGILDTANAQALAVELAEARWDDVRYLIIDFSGIQMLTSSGVGVLFSATDHLRKHDGDIILYNVSEPILYVLSELDVKEYFTIAADEQAAIALVDATL